MGLSQRPKDPGTTKGRGVPNPSGPAPARLHPHPGLTQGAILAHIALLLRTEGQDLNANTVIAPCTSPRGAKKHSPVYLKSS